jgi:mannose-6-phosphate isomerase-like protein (cupin superfamily)
LTYTIKRNFGRVPEWSNGPAWKACEPLRVPRVRIPPLPPVKINKKIMKGFNANIEKDTLENDNFRKVLYTSKHSQLVLMSLKPNEDIGMEIHNENDQFFRFEAGKGKVVIDGNEYSVEDGSAIVVPAGAEHNVINVSDSEELKLYTIYSPAHHKDGIVRKTKKEAEANEEDFEGQTTE